MARWEYRAYGAKGEVVSGRVTADSQQDAFSSLERLGLVPIDLKPLIRRTSRSLFAFSSGSPQKNLLFVRQLSTLTGAGVSMIRAVGSLAELQSEEADRKKILAIGEALRQGQSFSDALRQFMPTLPAYVPYLVEVGEATGEMTSALTSAAVQLERDLAQARDIKSALSYPMFLVAFGIAAVSFMFAVVVPQFSSMLEKSDAQLPAISYYVITIGNGLRAHSTEVMLGIALIVALIVLLSRQPKAAAAMFQAVLSLPGIGRVVRLNESSRWASMLAILLTSRVTITDAILVANRIVKDGRLRTSLAQVETALRRGSRLSDALEDFTNIDLRVVEMVRIGEQSGGLDKMLSSAAELLRDEAEASRKRFMALIEPMAVLLIGASIGTIVVGLMLAISSLYDKVL